MIRSKKRVKSLGEVFTPKILVDKMINKISDDKWTDPLFTVLEPTCGNGNFLIAIIEKKLNCGLTASQAAKTTFGVDISYRNVKETKDRLSILLPGEKLNIFVGDIFPIAEILKNKQISFDLVIGNPPYNSNMDLKILSIIEPLCKEMVVVHPSTWLLDLKGKYKPYKDFKQRVENKLKSVELFNGNPVFNIGLFGPCVITHIDEGRNGNNITVNYFGTEYEIGDLEDVTKFGKEWKTTVKPFMKQIQVYITKNSNVWQHNKLEINPKKFYCQFAAIRGSVNLTDIDTDMIKDDFHTLVIKDSDRNKGIRKNGMITFEFDTDVERDNFITYCKTDFARFCLALYKNSLNCHRGEMTLIPWMDFTQEWDDEKLYEFFEINKKTQEYIEWFLPDYYGIRKEKTPNKQALN